MLLDVAECCWMTTSKSLIDWQGFYLVIKMFADIAKSNGILNSPKNIRCYSIEKIIQYNPNTLIRRNIPVNSYPN